MCVITRVSTRCHQGKRWNVSLGVVTSREASWLGTRLTCLAIITSCTVLSTHTDPVPRFWGDVRALRVGEYSSSIAVSHAKGSGSHFSPKGGVMCDGRFAERPINWIDSRISSYMGW